VGWELNILKVNKHWHKLVKNIGGANPDFGGQSVVKTDKCMGVSQILGGLPL